MHSIAQVPERKRVHMQPSIAQVPLERERESSYAAQHSSDTGRERERERVHTASCIAQVPVEREFILQLSIAQVR